MIAPLGAGQLDVAGGAPAAGLYNAMGRGIGIKIVADRAHVAPGYGFNPVIVRKDLVTSGRYKKIADLRGMKVAESGKGSTTAPELEHFLAKGGLSYDDVKHVYLPFPEQVAALRNGSIDATLALEPWGTQAVREGVGVIVASNDRFYPDQQVSTVLYSGEFIKKRPEVAKRFMVAYLRGVRYYNDALRGGHLTGPTAEDVIAILSEELKIDRATLHEMVPGGIDPDGRVNLKSLEDDYAMFKRIGLTTSDVDVVSVVDMRFAQAASKQLGPYRPK
jgi:NitT/TauT family transport system substrate-binding protein